MKTLPVEFEKNADRLGTHRFKQLKRTEKVCLYERRRLDGRLFGYEVFIANSESFPLADGTRTEPKETYPTYPVFGRTAWFCTTLERVEQRFSDLCKT